jgi:hypothetical protein
MTRFRWWICRKILALKPSEQIVIMDTSPEAQRKAFKAALKDEFLY